MPEYLAPAVYVEEVDTGSKPIEGVSTSTTGMIGVAERGPVNMPILVTSNGEYHRWFGGGLNRELYGEHRFLPNAIEGFFTNGGKRVYVTRVLATDVADVSSTFVFDAAAPVPATTALLRPITTGAPATAYLVNLAGLGVTTPRTWLQIGSGGDVEFAKLDALAGSETDVTLDFPLSFPHAPTELVERHAAPAPGDFDAATTLSSAAAAGAKTIQVAAGGGILAGQFIQIRTIALNAGDAEFAQVKTVNGNTFELQAPLRFAHANGVQVQRLKPATVWTDASQVAAGMPASAGESVLQVRLAERGQYLTAGDLIKIGPAGATQEIRRIGGLSSVALKSPLARDYDQGTATEAVTEAAVVGPARLSKRALDAGATSLQIDKRAGLNEGDVLRIGLAADAAVEYAQIKLLPSRGPGDDAGLAILETPLVNHHDPDIAVEAQTFTRAAPGVTALAVAATKNATQLVVSDAVPGNTLLRLLPASGVPTIHKMTAAASAALTPRIVTLAPPLSKPHAASTAVQSTVPLFEVCALDAGQWGDRLRVAVRDPEKAMVDSKVRSPAALGTPDATHLRLESANGIEVGTVLQKWDPVLDDFTGPAFKVLAIDRLNGFLLTLAQAVALSPGDMIMSHEFDLLVYLLRQPDKANPSRDSAVIEAETFPALTLDPRHSRYLHSVVGATWDIQGGATVDDEGNALRRDDSRSMGESNLVRAHDVALDLATPALVKAAREGVRIGPRFDLETLPDGRTRPTRYALRGGDDQLSSVDDDTYIGQDNPDPEKRTGLYTLRNVEEISIVGAPGRTSPKMQNELIAHCELLRYRFAVLDAAPPPNDSMANVQAQRQQFDTKYAALYHPWLVIPDPYPASSGTAPDYPIPPSGHMLGIYARTDIERGVHKAPANEVVRGVIGLQRLLNKEQHDILNPYPVNINVIRDFRPNNRGIRVYGGRVITSDSDWKYVNVRRLLIFIEASIDRGLQWVVFEPNAEPLWARVRRAITNFLTLVWRNGALEGTKVEEAFFVKCDRTTMTQTDIDQGRLICLVGVAPVKPAEFVIVRIGLWTAHADD
jgi:hypothetical protein